MQRAAAGRAGGGEQPLLAPDEGDGGRRIHGTTQHRAGIGIQAGRDIQRQHRPTAGVHRVDGRTPGTAHLAVQTGAQQGIHHHVAKAQRARQQRLRRHARRLCRSQGIVAQTCRIAHLIQRHIEAGLAGQPRHHETVAAVVAGAAYHTDAPRLGPAPAQQRKGLGTGTLHQGTAGDALFRDRQAVQFPHLGGTVKIMG